MQEPKVEIIVNPDHAHTAIDRSLLVGMFTMRVRQWPDGAAVHVFVFPDSSAASDRFDRKMLGTYPYVLRADWDRLVFTGTGLAPTVVESEKQMRDVILKTPGAIGYVVGVHKAGEIAAPNTINVTAQVETGHG